ncbi:hypothetical protein QQ045_031964 [Rhodiola kirilowii]
MPAKVAKSIYVVFFLAAILVIRNPSGGNRENASVLNSISGRLAQSDVQAEESGLERFNEKKVDQVPSGLSYGYYGDTCPNAEIIVRNTMREILNEHKDTTAALLRLLFHDCFIEGCDASVMLDDSNGNSNKSIERQAIPNKTLKGFDKIDRIKEELERACPGVVSCADILVLATMNSIHMAGGPFYPVFTGRLDSTRSYFDTAMAEIPKPDDNITQTLHLFSLRGFDSRETVSLLGAHNIGKIGCDFIQTRLNNFQGTGGPDRSLTPNFLDELRRTCQDNNSSDNAESPTPPNSRKLVESSTKLGMTYFQGLSIEVPSGSTFDTHYYRSLVNNRGLLFADQQLMADDATRNQVRDYASDDGSAFRRDFARVMFKMSNLNVLTGQNGVVRLNCSMPVD